MDFKSFLVIGMNKNTELRNQNDLKSCFDPKKYSTKTDWNKKFKKKKNAPIPKLGRNREERKKNKRNKTLMRTIDLEMEALRRGIAVESERREGERN